MIGRVNVPPRGQAATMVSRQGQLRLLAGHPYAGLFALRSVYLKSSKVPEVRLELLIHRKAHHFMAIGTHKATPGALGSL